jgi:hypothetical protein
MRARPNFDFSGNDDGTLYTDLSSSGDITFGYSFSGVNDTLLTLYDKSRSGMFYFTRADSGISVDPPSGWSTVSSGLSPTPTIQRAFATASQTLLVGSVYFHSLEEGYTTSYDHVFVSNGDGWSRAEIGALGADGVSLANSFELASSGNSIALMTYPGELHLSTDEGASWTHQTATNRPWDVCPNGPHLSQPRLAISGSDLYVLDRRYGYQRAPCSSEDESSRVEIYRLEDFASGGNTWTLMATAEDDTYATTALLSVGTTLIRMVNGVVARSSDGAASWQDVSSGLPDSFQGANFFAHGDSAIVHNWQESFVLGPNTDTWSALGDDTFMPQCSTGTDLVGPKDNGIYKSSDLGQTTTRVGGNFVHPRRSNLKAHCGQGGRIFTSARILFEATSP